MIIDLHTQEHSARIHLPVEVSSEPAEEESVAVIEMRMCSDQC